MGQSLRTALCGELGIEYPIFLAGMGTAAGPELVTAVSEAGGFGVLGASAFPPRAIRELISTIRRRTARQFGVNIIIDERDLSAEDKAELREQVSAAIAEGVAAVVLFWGDPAPYVEEAHRHGVRLFIQIGSVDEAKAAATAGVDAVIAQGVEAGGHVRGLTSIWTLLPAVIESIAPLPVLASGGIGDGVGVARAIRMGAQGVSLGTRFVASDEASCHPAYKRRVVESTASDTVYSELFDVWWPNAPHRTLRNKTVSEWEAAGRPPTGSRPGEGRSIGHRRMGSGAIREWPRYAIGVATPDFDGDIDYAPLWAGESCSVVHDIKPAAQIVRDLVAEAQITLAGAPAPR
ncbi:MAG TPA: nitronate monooxygenase [Candidatus Acidoferrum sp.]|nr:nitronate monooxygenase [Candidatus Acidoferrum sp.]